MFENDENRGIAIKNGLTCIIAAMDVEFFAIINSFGINTIDMRKLNGKFDVVECGNILIARSGKGKLNAELCAEVIYKNHRYIAGFISAGTAGAIASDLRVGDIIAGDAVVEERQGIYEKISVAGWVIDNAEKQNVRIGEVFCSDKFFNEPEEKMFLSENTSVICVDMESFGIARFASKKGIPFIPIKAISDHADGNALRSLIFCYKEACDKLASYLSERVDFFETVC